MNYSAAIKEILIRLIGTFGVAVTGFKGMIIRWFLEKFLISAEKFLRDQYQKYLNKKALETDKKNEQKYQDVLNSDQKTEQDIDNATSDFLNGRKP